MALRLVVDSTTVLSVSYERASRILEVEFRHANEVYRFEEVPQSVYEALLRAPSKGLFFNEHIRDAYAWTRA
jgi:lysyl-tRNA synthetase, class II